MNNFLVEMDAIIINRIRTLKMNDIVHIMIKRATLMTIITIIVIVMVSNHIRIKIVFHLLLLFLLATTSTATFLFGNAGPVNEENQFGMEVYAFNL